MGLKTSQNLFIGFYFCALFSGVILLMYGTTTALAFKYDNFESTSGQISSTYTSEYSTDDNSGLCLNVKYNYTVVGKVYSATEQVQCSTFHTDIIDLAERYLEGAFITVYYNPNFPEESIIDKPSHPSEGLAIIILILIPASLVLICWYWYNKAFFKERQVMEKFADLSVDPELYYNSTESSLETRPSQDNERIDFEKIKKVDKIYFDEKNIEDNYPKIYLAMLTGIIFLSEFARLSTYFDGRDSGEASKLFGTAYFYPYMYFVELGLVVLFIWYTGGFFSKYINRNTVVVKKRIFRYFIEVMGLLFSAMMLMFFLLHFYMTLAVSYLGYLFIEGALSELGFIIPIYLIWMIMAVIAYPISRLWLPNMLRIYQRIFQHISLGLAIKGKDDNSEDENNNST